MVESFNQSVEAPDVYFFLAIIWILAFFFNTYLLYNFKKFGKQMYLYVFLASLVTSSNWRSSSIRSFILRFRWYSYGN